MGWGGSADESVERNSKVSLGIGKDGINGVACLMMFIAENSPSNKKYQNNRQETRNKGNDFIGYCRPYLDSMFGMQDHSYRER